VTNFRLSNLRIIAPFSQPEFIEKGWIDISNGMIESIGHAKTPPSPDVQCIDMGGKTVLPGVINAHTHLYSSLAMGMPPPSVKPVNFTEILQRIWWKLDRGLDADSVLASFQVGLLQAIKSGVTTVIDHHSSPNFIDGSTHRLVDTAGAFGIRVATAFEISDRNGYLTFTRALDENLTAVHDFASKENVHPMIGIHASFTLSDTSLSTIRSALKNLSGTGIHIHVAEDKSDEDHACSLGYESVIKRLHHFDLLTDRSLIIHGIHLKRADADLLAEISASLVHCPTSNANNRVGSLSTEVILQLSAGLGTDGMQANLVKEAKTGSSIRSASHHGSGKSVNYIELLYRNNPVIAGQLFQQKIGKIESGYPADLAFYDYHPFTEITSGNWSAHLLSGMDEPSDVMTRGIFRVKDHQFKFGNEAEIRSHARLASRRLWDNMMRV